jgi:hypothetical protein
MEITPSTDTVNSGRNRERNFHFPTQLCMSREDLEVYIAVRSPWAKVIDCVWVGIVEDNEFVELGAEFVAVDTRTYISKLGISFYTL